MSLDHIFEPRFAVSHKKRVINKLQYRPNGVFVIIEHHRLVCRAYFTNIITGNGIGVFRAGNVEEALITDKEFGEVGFSGIKRQGKMSGMVDEGPGSDVLVRQGGARRRL